MKPLQRVAALGLLLALRAAAQDKVELNTITQVQVQGGQVLIQGNKKPNFTTFTMTEPSRLVIDISEAVFSGVPEQQEVGNGTITAIKTASYGSDQSAIARVLIGFERDVDTDIVAGPNSLVVKIAGGAGGQKVAAADTGAKDKAAADKATADKAAADKAAADKAAKDQAAADKAAKEQAAKDAKAQAEADRKAKAQADADAKKQAAEEAKKKKEEDAAAQKQTVEEKAAAEKAAKEQAAADKAAKEQAR